MRLQQAGSLWEFHRAPFWASSLPCFHKCLEYKTWIYTKFVDNTDLIGTVGSLKSREACREILTNCKAGKWPAAWSLARARARLCTWDGAILGIDVGLGTSGWKQSQGIWSFWLKASCIWVNRVSWKHKKPTIPWGASDPEQLVGQGKGSCSALCWCSLT